MKTPMLALAAALFLAASDPEPIVILVVIDSAAERAADVRDGVTLGVEEAEHAAALLGAALEFDMRQEATGAAGDRAASAAVAAAPEDDLLRLARNSPSPVVAVAARPPRLLPASLFVVAYGRLDDGGGEPAAAEAGCGPATIEAWHGSLRRYGAGQLNERFERRFGRPMTGPAWAGWVAVKALSEAALRGASAGDRPLPLRDTLRALRFDGHKGRALYFDGDRTLVHPSYSVADCEGRLRVDEVSPAP